MLNDLDRVYPKALPALLHAARRSVENWQTGRRHPGTQAARLIWFAWVNLVQLRTPGPAEVLTWGRIRVDDPQ